MNRYAALLLFSSVAAVNAAGIAHGFGADDVTVFHAGGLVFTFCQFLIYLVDGQRRP